MNMMMMMMMTKLPVARIENNSICCRIRPVSQEYVVVVQITTTLNCLNGSAVQHNFHSGNTTCWAYRDTTADRRTNLFSTVVWRQFAKSINTDWGTAVAQWLRCCATNRKVAGSIPDGVIGIFH